MKRHCFQLQADPERLDEYKRRHAAVWPDMVRALKAAGWHNYSLFLRPDGLLIGYVESEDLGQAQRAMAATEVNARWQSEMREFFLDLDTAPDEGFLELEEVFNLEEHLARYDDEQPG
jgi:L-rhamnose mutarotase